jgi:hypothetical protein
LTANTAGTRSAFGVFGGATPIGAHGFILRLPPERKKLHPLHLFEGLGFLDDEVRDVVDDG